jgi:hypothetical protein
MINSVQLIKLGFKAEPDMFTNADEIWVYQKDMDITFNIETQKIKYIGGEFSLIQRDGYSAEYIQKFIDVLAIINKDESK